MFFYCNFWDVGLNFVFIEIPRHRQVGCLVFFITFIFATFSPRSSFYLCLVFRGLVTSRGAHVGIFINGRPACHFADNFQTTLHERSPRLLHSISSFSLVPSQMCPYFYIFFTSHGDLNYACNYFFFYLSKKSSPTHIHTPKRLKRRKRVNKMFRLRWIAIMSYICCIMCFFHVLNKHRQYIAFHY